PSSFKRHILPIREIEIECLPKGLLDFHGGFGGFCSFAIGVVGFAAAAATEKDLSCSSLPPVFQIIMSRAGKRERWRQRSCQKRLPAGRDNDRLQFRNEMGRISVGRKNDPV